MLNGLSSCIKLQPLLRLTDSDNLLCIGTVRTMSKRKRDPTFIASEKVALIELVEKYFAIIESKKTDAVSIKLKNEGWQKIAMDFNAVSSIHPRGWSVLKNCWENLKKRAKQEQNLRNQHFLGSGEGPPKMLQQDPVLERVLELIRSRDLGFVKTFASDDTHSVTTGDTTLPSSSTQMIKTEYVLHVNGTDMESQPEGEAGTDISPTTLSVDWYTPSMLKEIRNPDLTVSPPPSPEIPGLLENTEEKAQRSENNIQTQSQESINTLLNVNSHAEEEHAIQMSILRLQEQREMELLEQEKLRTKQEQIKLKILELELKKLKD